MDKIDTIKATRELRTLKKKNRLRDLFNKVIHTNESAEKTAFAFALGVFIAFSPLLGTHLLTVLVIVLFFRINRVAIISGALVNNPWTIVPMYSAATFFGFFIMGKSLHSLPDFTSSDLSSLSLFFNKFKQILYPYIFGCLVLGAIAATISYFIMKRLIIRMKKKSGQKIQKKDEVRDISGHSF